MICFKDICFYTSTLITVGAIGVAILIAISYAVSRSLGSQDSEGIQTINMEIKKTIPEDNSAAVVEESDEELDHPYSVGKKVFVGKTDSGLEAYLRLDRFDEDKDDLYATVLVELPLAATNLDVDHEEDDNFPLGRVSIKYELGGEVVEEKIWLENETLEDSYSNFIISAARGSKTDLTGVK